MLNNLCKLRRSYVLKKVNFEKIWIFIFNKTIKRNIDKCFKPKEDLFTANDNFKTETSSSNLPTNQLGNT